MTTKKNNITPGGHYDLTSVPEGFFDDERRRLKMLVSVRVAQSQRRSWVRRLGGTAAVAAASVAVLLLGFKVWNGGANLAGSSDSIASSLTAQVTSSSVSGSEAADDGYVGTDGDYSSADILMWLY